MIFDIKSKWLNTITFSILYLWFMEAICWLFRLLIKKNLMFFVKNLATIVIFNHWLSINTRFKLKLNLKWPNFVNKNILFRDVAEVLNLKIVYFNSGYENCTSAPSISLSMYFSSRVLLCFQKIIAHKCQFESEVIAKDNGAAYQTGKLCLVIGRTKQIICNFYKNRSVHCPIEKLKLKTKNY